MTVSRSEFWSTVERIRAADDRYTPDGYAFVMEALDATVRAAGERRHVSAAELLRGACRYARQRYGLLALTVLRSWGIRSGSDVGEIVFQLIEAGVLAKRDEDTRADFDHGIDFQTALEENYFDTGS
jgi:uncharacterized repeat protein (TIGR04138 family)